MVLAHIPTVLKNMDKMVIKKDEFQMQILIEFCNRLVAHFALRLRIYFTM